MAIITLMAIMAIMAMMAIMAIIALMAIMAPITTIMAPMMATMMAHLDIAIWLSEFISLFFILTSHYNAIIFIIVLYMISC